MSYQRGLMEVGVEGPVGVMGGADGFIVDRLGEDATVRLDKFE